MTCTSEYDACNGASRGFHILESKNDKQFCPWYSLRGTFDNNYMNKICLNQVIIDPNKERKR